MLCNELEGWDVGGREAQERGDICVHIADSLSALVQQKLMQHCKAVILQLKINLKKFKNNKKPKGTNREQM